MRGTSLIALRIGLLARLQDRPGLADVQVAYDKPATELAPDALWFDDQAEGDNTLPHIQAGERDVDETYSLGMVVQVLCQDGRDQQAADLRAVELLREVQKEVAETPRTIDAIEWIELTAWAYIGGPIGENSTTRAARFGLTFTVRARLYADED